MKFEIHYTINEIDYCYMVSGDTLEEIQMKNEVEMIKRNLDAEKNNCWSKERK